MQEQVYLSLLKRTREMRANMEAFAADLEKAGIDFSVQKWREALDREEEKIKAAFERDAHANRT